MPTLAIVDDQKNVREVVTEFLTIDIPNLKVLSFSKATDLFEALEHGTAIDVVIMDGNLHDGLSGPIHTKTIAEKYPAIYVIGFSASEGLAQDFLANGAKVFLSKASSINEIRDVVKTALASL